MGLTAAQHDSRVRAKRHTEFLMCLKDTGNITAACMVSGLDRSHIYKRRASNAEFREQWNAALEISIDKLEHVARHRAIKGTKEPIYYKGELIDHVYRPSDRLMELLLKAHRPEKFNPIQKLEHSGGVSVSIMQFGSAAPGAKTIEHDIGGVDFQGDTPKLAASENDEPSNVGIFLENFSDQSNTESEVIPDD